MPGQLGFPLTHGGLIEKPFCFTAETSFGDTPTASPVFTPVAVVGEIIPKIDDVEIDVRQIGSHDKYAGGGMQTAAHKYGFTLNLNPFDISFLGYGSKAPNYTTPSGTPAESLSFLLQYKQAVGASSFVTHFVLFKGSKCNTLSIRVNAEGLVEVSMEWICREITPPATTSGLTTPVIPDFSGITTPVISNIDGGAKPLTIGGTAYAVNDMAVNWNNNLIPDPFNGTGLIEALNVGERMANGSFVTPVGQDLTLETAVAAFPQTGVASVYKFKTAVMFANIAGLKVVSNDAPWRRGPTETKKNSFNWECTSAVLATA